MSSRAAAGACTIEVLDQRVVAVRFLAEGKTAQAAIELGNGTRLQVYKHYWTRRYLHLDGEGNAWFYREDGRYEQLVDDIIHHFNLVVGWHYPGQHKERCEERLALHEERLAEEARSGELAS